MLLEVCCDSVGAARSAESGGCGRIELCAALVDGGVTPSIGMVSSTVAAVSVPVNVLIRPRGGDFVYDETEVQVMCEDIIFVANAGASGVVIGALDESGSFDTAVMAKLVKVAKQKKLKITFHRAIDMAESPIDVLEQCASHGIDHVLTSGGANTALEGLQTIKLLSQRGKELGVTVIAASGVSETNIVKIARETGVVEVHGSLRSMVSCKTKYKKSGIFMGAAKVNDENSEFQLKTVDQQRVRAASELLARPASESC